MGPDIGSPVRQEFILVIGYQRSRNHAVFFQSSKVFLGKLLGFAFFHHAFRHQLFPVELARAFLLPNLLVHHWLGRQRLIRFIVPVAAEADDVDNNVLVEMHSEVQRELRHEHHCLGIVTVDVENWSLNELRDIGAVKR